MERTRSRVERLRLIEETLENRWMRATELAAMTGMGRRAIERDLAYLETQYGERLRRNDKAEYRLGSRASALNDVEALAMYMAARMLTHTGIGERHYRSTMQKLAKQVPEPAQSALLKRVEALKTRDRDRVLDLVAQAWFNRRILVCDYASASGKTKKRKLAVYFVEVGRRNHEPYALAVDQGSPHRSVLVFRFSRMKHVRLAEETYEIPEDFDAEAEIGDAFGVILGPTVEAHIRVKAGAVTAFREVAGDSLRSLDLGEDGSADAIVAATLDNQGRALELIPWLLTWGDAIEVVSPANLRDAVADAHRNAAAVYASG